MHREDVEVTACIWGGRLHCTMCLFVTDRTPRTLLGYTQSTAEPQSTARHLMGLSQDAKACHPYMPAWRNAAYHPLHAILLLASAMASNAFWGSSILSSYRTALAWPGSRCYSTSSAP